MMQARLAWQAFKNMLRAAGQDPLWAFTGIIMSPFTAAKHVFGTLVLLLIVGLALSLVAMVLPIRGTIGEPIALLVIVLILLALLFRLITNPMIHRFGNLEGETHGSARLSTQEEIAPLIGSGGLMIGRDVKTQKPLYYDGPAHLLTMAPTRTGKGVGTIIPNLLTLDRSIICIDPKGENANIAGYARETYGPTYVLDPFQMTDFDTSSYNPFDAFDVHGMDVAEDANVLADALVYDEPGTSGDAHWNEEAKALIAGLILYIAAHEPQNRRSLATLREYLTLPPDTFAALLGHMQTSHEVGGLIARAANRHLGKSDREGSGVMSAAQRHTHFLDSPRMTHVLGTSDFSFADLKNEVATVFLVLPPDRLGTYSRWLRLLITQSLTDMARTPPNPANTVLYLLDEFAALGYLAPVERAMGLMAGYGVQLWPILQDVHQLRATYRQRAGTFISNAGVLQVFGVNDHESAELVSNLLGQETVVFQTMGRALDSDQSGLSFSEQHVGRALLTPDEVRNLGEYVQLLFLAGQRPIIANKLRYYQDPEFDGLFIQDHQ